MLDTVTPVPPLIRLNPLDNVAVARLTIDPLRCPVADGVVLRERIATGHKVATLPIAAGAPVIKYGQAIGFANRAIEVGDHVHTPMFERMREDMDVDCGTVVTGRESIEEAGARIFEAVLATASGRRTGSELFDYGDNEFVPWQVGAVM